MHWTKLSDQMTLRCAVGLFSWDHRQWCVQVAVNRKSFGKKSSRISMFVETKLFALDWIGPPLEHSMSALPLTTTHHHYDTVCRRHTYQTDFHKKRDLILKLKFIAFLEPKHLSHFAKKNKIVCNCRQRFRQNWLTATWVDTRHVGTSQYQAGTADDNTITS